MSDYKELFEKRFDYDDLLKNYLHNYFPEYDLVFTAPYEEGIYKYEWKNYIIIKYFNELYKVSITSYGNGGWQSIDECHITAIKKVKRVEREIKTTIVEYI